MVRSDQRLTRERPNRTHSRGLDAVSAPMAPFALSRRAFAMERNAGYNESVQSSGDAMAETIIRALPNGPYRVTGPAKVIDPQGNEIIIDEGRTVSLCRCGGSVNKPYCDGTHSRIGFQAAEAAVQKSG